MNDNEDDDLYGGDEPAQRVGNGPEAKAPAGKLENVAALGKNPKTSRVIIATVGAVVLVGSIAVIGIVSKNKRAEAPPPAELSGAAVGSTPALGEDRSAALADSAQYKDIVAAASKERSKTALENGESAQPLAATIESTLKAAPTPAEAAASAAKAEEVRLQQQALEQAKAQALAAQQMQAQQQQQGYQQQNPQGDQVYQQQLTNAQAAMAQLMAPRARGSQVYGLVDAQTTGGGLQQVSLQGGGAGQAGTAGGASSGSSTATAAAAAGHVTLIGAGIIESARMDMGANTDVGGDFVATLLTGKWAGAKLIGSVQRRGELAAMTVRTMSLPAQGVSVPATAVILDPETAEGGTATDVDRKLFIKYGVKPLAAGFAAVADYLKNSGTTVVVNGETVTTSQPELTNKKAGQIVAGSAAQQVSADANALDTTPTVRVRRGAIVGVFFTQDVLYSPK
jgi:hypothetical protein